MKDAQLAMIILALPTRATINPIIYRRWLVLKRYHKSYNPYKKVFPNECKNIYFNTPVENNGFSQNQ